MLEWSCYNAHSFLCVVKKTVGLELVQLQVKCVMRQYEFVRIGQKTKRTDMGRDE